MRYHPGVEYSCNMGLSMKINVAFVMVLLAAIANQSSQRSGQLLYEDYIKSSLYGALAFVACAVTVLCLDVIRLNPADTHDSGSLTDQYLFQKRHNLYGRWIWKRLRFASRRSQASQESDLMKALQAKKVANRFGYKAIPNLEFFQDNIPFSNLEETSKEKSEAKGSSSNFTFNRQRAVSLMEYISSKNVSQRMGRPLVLLQGCYNNQNPGTSQTQTDFLYSSFRHLSFWCYPKGVHYISDEETYLCLAAIYSLKEREVSYILASDSSMLYAFWMLVSKKWPEICDVIESGFIPEKMLNVDQESFENITDNFRGHRSRARELREEFRKGFTGIASRIWRSCSYVQTLKTELVSPEWGLLLGRELLHIPILKTCKYLEGELVAFPETLRCGHYFISNVQSFFFEWIHVQDTDSDWPDTTLSNEVLPGNSYEMVVTSYDCQFIRCRTGLMVNIVGGKKECPTFNLTSSYDYLINIEDEETRVDLLAETLRGTTKRFGGSLVNFAVTESVTDSFNIDSLRSYRLLHSGIGRVSYHYVLFIELDKPDNKLQLESTELAKFDKDLCLIHTQYQRVRKLKKLAPMKVIEVEFGTFQKLRSFISRDKKVPPCNTPKILRTVNYLEFLLSQSKANFGWKKTERKY